VVHTNVRRDHIENGTLKERTAQEEMRFVFIAIEKKNGETTETNGENVQTALTIDDNRDKYIF